MDIVIPFPLPRVESGDLIERLNKRRVSPLVLEAARQYAEPNGKAQAWTAEQKAQIKKELAAYPLFVYLSLAFATRSANVSRGATRYKHTPAPLRGRIAEEQAEPYRAALDWFALAGLVQNRTRLGICPGCDKFFVDAKHRGKTTCSSTCGSRLRARTRYKKLMANRRKYNAYLKKQAQIMRERRANPSRLA